MVAHTKITWFWEFLSQIALVLFLWHLNRFMDCTDFTPHFEGCLENHENMYLLSTSVDPVNETLLMSMCSEIAAPAVGP